MLAGKRPRRRAARCPAPAESAGRAAASGEANDCFYPVSFRTQYSSRVVSLGGVLRDIISQQSAASSHQMIERKGHSGRKGSKKSKSPCSFASRDGSFLADC